MLILSGAQGVGFQPTPPARTETSRSFAPCTVGSHFNPLRPRGRRRGARLSATVIWTFQPTPPARTETISSNGAAGLIPISTHSAHEDGDTILYLLVIGVIDFNPLRPRGRRRFSSPYSWGYRKYFNPLRPRGRRQQYYTKNQQFFITFPQSNHIIPSQITANLPCTHPKPFSLCSFSGANPPVNSCLLQVRTKLFETSLPPAARSEYQRLFHFNPFTHPNMFNLCSVFISQVVKSKAVRLLINDICQYGF